MTVRELSRLYYIQKIIDQDAERLAELEAMLQPGGIKISGMPHSSSQRNVMEEIMPLIIETKEAIRKEKREYECEKIRLEGFIRSVEDCLVRSILQYRFMDMLTWANVAKKVGGKNTEDGVKKMCYRFLKKTEKNKSCPECPDSM